MSKYEKIDVRENANYEQNLKVKKKSDSLKKVAVLSKTIKVIVSKENYRLDYMYDKFKKFFGRMPDEREKMFIIKNNVKIKK